MATGYTWPVREGEVTEFRAFALDCARAFGALISLKEESRDTPIPEVIKPDHYHRNRLAEALVELATVEAWTDETATELAEQEHADAIRRNEEAQVERLTTLTRYEKILTEAVAWVPPTADHVEFREFMVRQLSESIESDCREWSPSEYVPLDGPAFKARKIARAQENVAYHEREWQAEQDRAASRTAWVQTLIGALPVPADA